MFLCWENIPEQMSMKSNQMHIEGELDSESSVLNVLGRMSF